jgi:hypothetical protein
LALVVCCPEVFAERLAKRTELQVFFIVQSDPCILSRFVRTIQYIGLKA